MFSAERQWFSSFLLEIDILWCVSLCVLTQPAFVSASFYIYQFWFILLLYLWLLETQRRPLGSWAGLWVLKLVQSRCLHTSRVCPALQLLLTSLSDDSLCHNEHKNRVECVIFFTLPHSSDAIHRILSLYVHRKGSPPYSGFVTWFTTWVAAWFSKVRTTGNNSNLTEKLWSLVIKAEE